MNTYLSQKLQMLKPISVVLLLSWLSGCADHSPAKLLWHAPIASYWPPVVGESALYVQGFRAGHPKDDEQVFALDKEMGKERWVSKDREDCLSDERVQVHQFFGSGGVQRRALPHQHRRHARRRVRRVGLSVTVKIVSEENRFL